MGSGAENIYTLPPPAVPPLGEAAPRTPGAGPGRPRGGGSLSTETPGPGLAPSRQPGGALRFPRLHVWGRVEGPRGEGRLQNSADWEEAGGAVPQRAPRRIQPHGSGRARRTRRCPTATACHGSGTLAAREELVPGTPGAGSGVTSRVLGSTQSKAKERKLPTPTIHLLKSE